jgi:ankyrin repeat protein
MIRNKLSYLHEKGCMKTFKIILLVCLCFDPAALAMEEQWLGNFSSLLDKATLGCDLPLQHAIWDNNIEFVEQYIKNGENVNSMNGWESPLHCAITWQRNEISKLFIAAGADLEQADDFGNTPLLRTAEKKNYEVTLTLLLAGANPTHCSEAVCNDNELLLKANVLWGNYKICTQCLWHATDNLFSSVWLDADPYYFLEYSKVVNKEITDQEWYAIINQQDELGATALAYAATAGNVKMVKWLLDHGANPSLKACGKTVLEFLDYILTHTLLSEQQRDNYLKIIDLCKFPLQIIVYQKQDSKITDMLQMAYVLAPCAIITIWNIK